MASITYEHIWKRFGEVVAVQDLDIFIEAYLRWDLERKSRN